LRSVLLERSRLYRHLLAIQDAILKLSAFSLLVFRQRATGIIYSARRIYDNSLNRRFLLFKDGQSVCLDLWQRCRLWSNARVINRSSVGP